MDGTFDADRLWETVLRAGNPYPADPQVLAVGHVIIALAQAHEISLIQLMEAIGIAFRRKIRDDDPTKELA